MTRGIGDRTQYTSKHILYKRGQMRQLTSLDIGINFDDCALVVNANNYNEALTLLRSQYNSLLDWTRSLGLDVALIKVPGSRPFRIPANIHDQGFNQMDSTSLIQSPEGIAIAQMKLTRPLLDVLVEFMEQPGLSAGIVRLSDERQVIVTDSSAGFAFNYPNSADLTGWRRQEYWNLQDLDNFNREWRSQLEPNNPSSTMEYRYRSCDRITRDNWKLFTTKYRLLDIAGELYQVCYSVAVDAIAVAPA